MFLVRKISFYPPIAHIASWWVALIVLLMVPATSQALELGSPFQSHMVLQRDMAVTIWGKAQPGEAVQVTFQNHQAMTNADESGYWQVKLPPLNANAQGQSLTVAADQTESQTVLEDVLVGDVWLCGGQSNMEWSVNKSNGAKTEIAAADHPLIRLAQIPRTKSNSPQPQVEMTWSVCSPQTISSFSAVGYYFGRALQKKLDVPMGLISANWGGTPAESWLPADRLKDHPELQPTLDRWKRMIEAYPHNLAEYKKKLQAWKSQPKDQRGTSPRAPQGPEHARRPGALYNAMIHPLIPMAIKGAIWYQGESNASRAKQYATLLPRLIESWRDAFEQPQMPFGIVSLANFREPAQNPGDDNAWAELRWAQYLTAANDPHTGLAITIDIGEAKTVHPGNKQDVGRRLARWALSNVYDREVYSREVPASGPVLASMKIEGDKVRLRFKHAQGGLVAKNNDKPGRFQIQDHDGQWHWAMAEIQDETVIVRSPKANQPKAVRYAWESNPPATLYNKSGLPMVPFRTDDEPWSTADRY